MNTPDNLHYSPSHEWVRIKGDEAVVGITAFAQDQLGDITFVDLPAPGTMLQNAQEMGSVESVKAASEIYSPVTGEVLEVNAALEARPELINESPYESGWLIRVKLLSFPTGLLSAGKYEELTASEAH